MRPARAIEELQALKRESKANTDLWDPGAKRDSWKAKVDIVLVRSLGQDSETLAVFRRVSTAEDSDHFLKAVATEEGLIDAAIYELRLQGGDEPIAEHAYDPELWAHVKTLVEDEEWGEVASQTAIFVENHVRTWAGNPQDNNGNSLAGNALYAEVFSNASPYRLGRQESEWEGWRGVGVGVARALGNVDRHRSRSRDDAKRYAIGVLGLGSLLLTQLFFEHRDILKTNE